jgi:hypothetical protein
MEARPEAIGDVYFLIDVDIPDEWTIPAGTNLTWKDQNGVYDKTNNTVTFTATTDFVAAGTTPSEVKFTTYRFFHKMNYGNIPERTDVKIVVQGNNVASCKKKKGTVTNSAPNPTR